MAQETGHALACVFGNMVTTGGAILARLRLTLIDLRLAVNPYHRTDMVAFSQDMRSATLFIPGLMNTTTTITALVGGASHTK